MNKFDLPYLVKDGTDIDVHSVLGQGGSKTVLEVSVDGMKRAIAVPNMTDPFVIRESKWSKAMKEPLYAEKLRDAGFLVNPEYAIDHMLVDGEATKVLSMLPFSELPFTVWDGKDGTATYEQGPLSHVESYETIPPAISGISRDIRRLAEQKLLLRGDGISFATMPSGAMRLFLFNLADIRQDKNIDSKQLALAYAQMVVAKLDNLFDFEQLRRFEAQGYDLFQRRRLAEKLVGIRLTK